MSLKDKFINQLSKLGKAMLIPMVIMPIAGVLGRLFAEDLLNVPTIANLSTVVFGNIDLMFAMGAALAYSKAKDKTTVLFASAISYLIFTSNIAIINETVSAGVFGGIIYGVCIALLYNVSVDWKLPSSFNFFSGEKMVITLSPIFALVMSYVFGFIWPYFQNGLNVFGVFIGGIGIFGIFIYGFLNRLLIPFGLHHVLNAYFAFEYGTYVTSSGEEVRGDIIRYIAGDPSAGSFFTGMYIVIIFGIPAINYAISKSALYNQKEVKGTARANAITSILSGVSEPTEFSFMFASPKLYLVHSILSGLAGTVAYLLGSRVGTFSQSGGIDFIINFGYGTNAWMVLPIGVLFFALYYYIFKFFIQKDNILTPGREQAWDEVSQEEGIADETVALPNEKHKEMAVRILEGLGGKENIVSLENCVTRLRLELKDASLMNEEMIKRSGSQGIMKMGANNVHIVIGTHVNSVAREIKKLI